MPRLLATAAVAALSVAGLAAAALATGTLGTATVVSASMAPAHEVGSHLVTTRVGAGDPGRGDVIVFSVPEAWQEAAADSGADLTSGLMVKRVIGVGGDRIVCCAPGGRLVVNDEVLDEPYLASPPEDITNPTYDVTVPDDHLWVLGDNRRRSFDSRAMHARDRDAGFVPTSAVRGRVLGDY